MSSCEKFFATNMRRFAGLSCKIQRLSTASDGVRLSDNPDPASKHLHPPLQRFSKPRHSWTYEDRVVLCILYRWFVSADLVEEQTLSSRDMGKVWREYVKDYPCHNGRLLEISDAAIQTQLYHICVEAENNQAWCEVFVRTSFLDEHRRWQATRQDLEACASLIGVNLLPRTVDSGTPKLSEGSTPRRRLHSKYQTVRSETPESYVTWSNDDSEIEEFNASNSRFVQLITPPISPETGGVNRSQQPEPFLYHPPSITTAIQEDYNLRPKGVGLVGWRFFDDDSNGLNSSNGFLAGRFIHDDHDLEPPHPNTEDFRQTVVTHLLPEPRPSPWISVWKNMLPSLHRCLRSTRNAHIAFINVDYIRTHQQGLYHAKDAIKQTTMYGQMLDAGYRYRYNGKGEFVVWRKINREAILTTISREMLDDYLVSHPDLRDVLRLEGVRKCESASAWYKLIDRDQEPLNAVTGALIGHFLAFTGLPRNYLDAFAAKMAYTWRFQQRNIGDGIAFYLNGVRAGFAAYEMEIGNNCTAQPTQELDEAVDAFMERRKRIEFTLGITGRGST